VLELKCYIFDWAKGDNLKYSKLLRNLHTSQQYFYFDKAVGVSYSKSHIT